MFDKQSQIRIAKSVIKSELAPDPPVPRFNPQNFGALSAIGGTADTRAPFVVIADEDIEHDDFGTVNLYSGTGFDQTLTESTAQQWSVYNPGLRVWEGSRLLIMHCRMAGGAKQTFNILHAWSATRITGLAPVGGIMAGNSGTATSVSPINGHYGPTTATVYLETTNVDVAASEKVWAELTWTGTESRWEIYASDCV